MLAIKTLTDNLTTYRRSVRLMGDKFEISVVGNNPLLADEQIDLAVDEINRVEKLLSAFSDDSSINQINRNAGIAPVKADGETFRLISRAVQISELTYGSFDITYLTDKNEDHGDVTVKATQQTKTLASYKSIVLDAANQTVFLKQANMRIGFGANGKGYAADRAKYVLQMNGVDSGVINVGGDLLTWGLQPGAMPWTVADADPGQAKQPFADLEISNMAFATSVNAEKYASISNKKFVNVLNPKKGFPVSGISSVSMLSPTAEFADAMATPILSMGVNAGLYLINQLNQVGCIIIDDQSRVYTSKDISL
ncbi:thiamine biosynthesis lipoprotein [Mucilaginibacter oryzae]|uniref:FAD:protein FMN transferase n=1 Tax=Mucilaginibacter oryzae TaxID=468058 RepID=A0A316H2H6_9SPHI|nr:FAD:protein FMN transferase [Mucilaginibacter oryzae]PWK72951.1 thiamine biosynthesis lipoprotein [Mucilaginibacter oryzae]